jgi:phospholipid/cholesterol/gamma-HCH transport system substrate-binding protein
VTDYETIQRRRNLIVGVFVIVGLAALVWLIFKFGDLPIKVSELRSFAVIVQFPTAKGIQRNAPVQFCGYQIGRVTDVMAPEKLLDLQTGLAYHQTKVILSIDKKYVDIPSNVSVKLMTRGLGSSYIELVLDPALPLEALDPNRPETKFLVDGMLLQGSTGMTSEFFPAESQKKFEELIDSFNSLVKNANDILGDQTTKQNFKAILANLSTATEQATETLKQVQEFSAAGTATLKNADAGVDKLVIAMVGTTEQLSKTISQLRVLLEKINEGQGTAGKLVNDGRLYESMLESTEQLQVLLTELKSLIAQIKEKGLRSIY